MNIFYLHNDPKVCAEMHLDKHVVKMILEYCQLLSTAHRVIDGTQVSALSKTGRKVTRWLLNDERESVIYSATHINHPSAVWVRQSNKNYDWLYSLLQELMREYTHRYGKIHACSKLGHMLAALPNKIPLRPFTEPTPAMPDEYKVIGDSVISYRNYYIHDKVRIAKWTKRNMPQWFEEGTNNANV
jgi:hypothetical protein